MHEPTQVMSCCNLLAPVHHLSFNNRSPRMSFSQVQGVFIVEHYLASRSYLTCQNEFRDTFPDSPVPKKSTISRLVNRFRDTGSVQDRNSSGRPLVLSDDSLDDIRHTLLRCPWKSLRKLSLQSGLSHGNNLFFDKQNMCQERVEWLFDHPVYWLSPAEGTFTDVAWWEVQEGILTCEMSTWRIEIRSIT
jgi:hypothetical protein